MTQKGLKYKYILEKARLSGKVRKGIWKKLRNGKEGWFEKTYLRDVNQKLAKYN